MSRGSWLRNDTNTRRRPSGEMMTLELPTCVERITTLSPRSSSRRVTEAGGDACSRQARPERQSRDRGHRKGGRRERGSLPQVQPTL